MAPGKGVDSMCSVPERSMRSALIGWDDIVEVGSGFESGRALVDILRQVHRVYATTKIIM